MLTRVLEIQKGKKKRLVHVDTVLWWRCSLIFLIKIMIAASFYADYSFFFTFDSGARSAGESDTSCIIEELNSLLR